MPRFSAACKVAMASVDKACTGARISRVAMILDKGNDALVRYFVEQRLVLALFYISARLVLLAPGASDGVDIEAQLLLVLAPAPATVDAPQTSSRRIGQLRQGFVAKTDIGLTLLNNAIRARQEAVGGLQFEPLALAILIIDGDAFDRYRFTVSMRYSSRTQSCSVNRASQFSQQLTRAARH
jgi:hypothetical protein